ncbi:MAG: META domain-containing protein [Dysgonamonadaceae bacterium]|jgi:heat shock protein HslJ|nr:META domain-containing protein [Dysgonamonadaceae bacterium]
MKRIFLLMGILSLMIGMNACKSKQETAKVAEPVSIDGSLVNKHWKLVELFGEPVKYEGENAKEAYITLKEGSNEVSGNLGCNTFHGSYQLGAPGRISFSQMASTKMMCINNMTIEDQMSKALNTADSYTISGNKLILNRARMAPLAVFEAVYMK